MKHYSYRVYKNQLTHVIYAGTVSAEDMDSAVDKVIKSCKIQVIHEVNPYSLSSNSYFILDNQRVGILIYANAEEH